MPNILCICIFYIVQNAAITATTKTATATTAIEATTNAATAVTTTTHPINRLGFVKSRLVISQECLKNERCSAGSLGRILYDVFFPRVHKSCLIKFQSRQQRSKKIMSLDECMALVVQIDGHSHDQLLLLGAFDSWVKLFGFSMKPPTNPTSDMNCCNPRFGGWFRFTQINKSI